MRNMNQTMPLEQAFNIIDGTLAQVNTNRENHALIETAVQRIRDEITGLNQQLEILTKEHYETLETLSLNSVPSPPPSHSEPS